MCCMSGLSVFLFWTCNNSVEPQGGARVLQGNTLLIPLGNVTNFSKICKFQHELSNFYGKDKIFSTPITPMPAYPPMPEKKTASLLDNLIVTHPSK